MKLDHVGISVSDLAQARRFYGEVLGFSHQEDSFELAACDIRGVVLINPDGAASSCSSGGARYPASRDTRPTVPGVRDYSNSHCGPRILPLLSQG